MKSIFQTVGVIGVGLAFGIGLLTAQTSGSNIPRGSLAPAITSSQLIVNGEVAERNENGFTVLTRTSETTVLLVTKDTSITKGGVTIKLSELAVADKVSVTAMRTADGKLVAISVVVRVGDE